MIGLARTRRAIGTAWRGGPANLVSYVSLTPVIGALPVLIAWLTKLVLDGLVGPPGTAILGVAVALAVAAIAMALVPHLQEYLRTEVGRRAGLLALDELYGGTERLTGLRRLEEPTFQNTIRLAEQAGRDGPSRCVDGLLGLVQAAVLVVGFLGALTVLNPVLAGLVAASGAPALLAEVRLSRRRATMLWEIGPAERREMFYAGLLTNLSAAKEVRLLRLGPVFRRRMLRELTSAGLARRAQSRRELRVQGLLAGSSAVLAGGGLVWAVLAARSGALTVGDVAVFIAALAGVQSGLAAMVGQIASVHQAMLLLEHYEQVVDCAPDLPQPDRPLPVPALRDGIELRDVWFRYGPEHPWVLRGVNLRIPSGQSVALVGHNGAGKTTLVKLLCRFYDPTRGAVLWDGVDIRELALGELRARVGAVFQDYMTYDLTAAENIWLGDVPVDGPDDVRAEDAGRIEDAARRAGIHETLRDLPRGYGTMLSRTFELDGDPEDNGVLLSGGQWQRVAIARAVLPPARDVLILDEPSAGLDAEAERDIHLRLRAYRAGRTSVLISHRLGTLRDADLIVVLRGGQVAESGRHAELMAAGGVYADLFGMQAEGYLPLGTSTSTSVG
ncbi:ABC transporter ATP-binding protein [Plantactinospora soyae]|uniref:ATP-binding cassette subfamily B protein n=1 Tax=Plantactinospora soyae TaxID=1544732 RepID=A0A927MHW6_9ACTN|nr:ABC transporter ATP-binding protein [Plantactinospora soyae]MBE1491455.1 ATP-binding cassette subfamily B protein [Plantactinospora soyae]